MMVRGHGDLFAESKLEELSISQRKEERQMIVWGDDEVVNICRRSETVSIVVVHE